MQQRALMWAAIALALAGCQPPTPPVIQVYFSPGGNCTEAIVRAVADATNSVHVQAYSFTSAPIAKALVEAHRRNIRVRVLLDDSQRGEKYSSADFLDRAGIKPRIDSAHAIAHNKVIVIDERIVITGSFNFTKAAEERNAENLLVISDRRLAKKYLSNWHAHFDHSEAYSANAKARTSDSPDKDSPADWETWRRFFDQFLKSLR